MGRPIGESGKLIRFKRHRYNQTRVVLSDLLKPIIMSLLSSNIDNTGDLVKCHLEARQTTLQFANEKPTLEQVKDYQGTILISKI